MLTVILSVAGLGALLLLLSTWFQARGGAASPEAVADAGAGPSVMKEPDRAAYVAKFVTVEALAIGPDLKPDSQEPVPGLLRVTGTVVNGGSEAIPRVGLRINPLGEKDEVLGSYVENIAGHKGLAPGERRAFKFEIPEKPGFSGRFHHAIQ